jgi:osomolarity two-component system, sensor histidine kinase TcsA
MSVDEAFEAFTPIPSLLLDSAFNIIKVSASFRALNRLTLDECLGVGIYDLAKSRSLIPGLATLQLVLDNAVTTKRVHSASEHQASGRIYPSLRAVPIFEQDTLLYVLLEVQDTSAEHEKRDATNDQLDTNDTYRVLVETVRDYAIL